MRPSGSELDPFPSLRQWSNPGETNDRALSDVAERDRLLDDLLAWIERVPAPLPRTPNPAFDVSAGKAKKKNAPKQSSP